MKWRRAIGLAALWVALAIVWGVIGGRNMPDPGPDWALVAMIDALGSSVVPIAAGVLVARFTGSSSVGLVAAALGALPASYALGQEAVGVGFRMATLVAMATIVVNVYTQVAHGLWFHVDNRRRTE